MTVTPLTGPFIAAKGFTPGRAVPVTHIVVHTAEGAKTREALGSFFHGSSKGSSNAGMDERGVDGYAEFVHYDDTPWTNPPINGSSDTLEICGFAKWTRAEWLAKKPLLEGVAHWIAWRAQVRGIAITHRHSGQTGAGVYGHKDVNDAYHKSTHTDPGPGFPWDVVIARAQVLASPAPTKPYPTLKYPMGGDGHPSSAVHNMQKILGLLPDGVFTRKVEDAVKNKQRRLGQTPTGIAGPAFLKAIGFKP